MRVVCISDTHNCNGQIVVPDGDLLIHSGDATVNGTVGEIVEFNRWFAGLPHRRKIFVAGNHDWLFERDDRAARELLSENVEYLRDSSVEVDGIHIYGSPWQPRFFDWAFNLDRGPKMAAKWRLIPHDVEILITHGPPHGIRDAVPRKWGIDHSGCEELLNRVNELAPIGNLKAHVFGHIHCGYGTENVNGIRFVNASNCDEQYQPTQPPLFFDI